MDRRTFLGAAALATLLPMTAKAAGKPLDYAPGLVKKRLDAGETVFLDFKADWCSTCRAQERAIEALKNADPAYDAAITFINVDWDQYKGDALTKSLKIPRRSTLVVLKGEEELGRIVAGTGKDEIKALMDVALAAAASS